MSGIDASAQIHPSSVIDPGAQIGPGVQIGPFCVVDEHVVLGAGVRLKSHVVVTGRTTVGEETVIFPFSNIGDVPQDLKYKGEPTRLEIGARNTIREGVTLNIGTAGGGGVTRLGDDGLYMTGVHIGHDVQVGDRVILANDVAMAGHAIIEDDVIFGGLSGAHQFCRVGRGAIIGGQTMVAHDVIPYGLVHGARGKLEGLNLIGLKRRGVPRDEIAALRRAYRELESGEGTFLDRARRLAEQSDSEKVQEVAAFILSDSERAFHTPGN